ncbi:MAG: hypothetical protein RL616_1018 [Verrucomicrobiota bacterium]|jgi:hypothetical protein
MFNRRYRFVVWAVASIVGIWLVATAGRWFLENRKVTAERVGAYVASLDFSQLAGDARARALKELEDKLNALSYEERQKLRNDKLMKDWFANMTDEEKAQFIEATMPTGFKQMIGAFEQMSEAKRKAMIDSAMMNLRGQNAARNPAMRGTNAPPPISPELEAKIRTIGLNSFYSQSSAQTKAELAPLLEEMQRDMESGRLMRRR